MIFKDSLYLLSWLNHRWYSVDVATLETRSERHYPRDGWGLTTDGKHLIASDGSSKLFYMDSDGKVDKKLHVTLEDKSVRYLNELEYIDGRIWANVYLEDRIVIIRPEDGKVCGVVDCRGLLDESLRDSGTDVLNGIAFDGKDIYLTGKNWPEIYKVELVPRPGRH